MSKIIEGNLPLTIENQNTEKIKNYQIYGTANGAGVETENLFNFNANNPDNGYFYGMQLTSNGNVAEYSQANISEYISITPSSSYTFSYGNQYNSIYAALYNAQKEFIRSIKYGGQKVITFSSQEDEVYLRFTYYRAARKSVYIVEGSTPPETYIPYGYKIPLTVESGVTENLFDKDATDTNNGYVDNSYLTELGTVTTGNGFCISEYMSVEAEENYTLNAPGLSSMTNASICFYDSNKSFISGGKYNNRAPITFSSPVNSMFAKITVYKSWISGYVFVKGSTAPDHYIPHRYTSNYDLFIGDTKLGAEEYVDYESGKVWKQFEISGLSEPLCGIGEYKDTLDLSTGTLTRRVKKLVLTGIEQTWSATYWSRAFVLYDTVSTTRPQAVPDIGICSHFKQRNGIFMSSDEFNVRFTSAYNRIVIGFGQSEFETIDDFKSFLAVRNAGGVPVIVWYILNTPTTETITVPIGLTGTIDGYLIQDGIPTQKSPIYPTANGEKQPDNTYSVLTLQPTDLPVALPELSLYKGTNTLSSTTELGKVILDYSVPEISEIQFDNQLYDLIDRNFYNIIANSYSSSLTYNEGDYCIYNYQLYKCISTISIPEDFDSEKWSQVTLAESLRGD